MLIGIFSDKYTNYNIALYIVICITIHIVNLYLPNILISF